MGIAEDLERQAEALEAQARALREAAAKIRESTVNTLTNSRMRAKVQGEPMQATDRGLAISASRAISSNQEDAIRALGAIGHSVRSAAAEIGVSPSMLSRVLAGEKRLGAAKAAALAALMAKAPVKTRT